MAEVVIVRMNRRRCVLLGIAHAVLALVFLGLVALPLANGLFDGLVAAGLLTAGVFGWFALHFLALAARNPVALRLDDKGISGFYADPATWDDIKSVFAFEGSKRRRFLGVELLDPVAFRDRQTAFRRFLSSLHGATQGAHLVVPEQVLDGATADALAKTAAQFLARHHG